MSFRLSAIRAALLAALMAGPAGAWADAGTAENGTVWTLDEAVERVEALYPGRVLSARELEGDGSERIFVVRILTEDREVRTLRIEQGTEVHR